MEARGFALMATTDSCPEFVLRYMMVLSRSFWVRHPWHAECAIVCKRVFAVQGKLHPAAEMRQIVGLEKPAYQTHRNDTAGRGGRKMPRLRSPSCRFEVGVSETVANWALKQLCWTWVTEGFWRFQLTDCTRNGTFEEANPFHFLGVSEVTGAIWRDAAQRSFRRDSRLLRTLLGLSRWETMGNILILSSSASVQWMEMTGMLRIVSSCKVWLHSTRFRTTCSVCQFPGASCSSKGSKRRGPFVQQMP